MDTKPQDEGEYELEASITRPARSRLPVPQSTGAAASRLGHLGTRHPLCPSCKYDLVATIEANRRICPECGYEFEMDELLRAPRPGDWTPGHGLARAALRVAARAAWCLPIWIGVLWGVLALGTGFATGRRGYAVSALLILLLTAGWMGKVLVRGVDEIAGMVSRLVAGVCFVAALVVIIAGGLIVNLWMPLDPRTFAGIIITSGGAAMAMIVKVHYFSDY